MPSLSLFRSPRFSTRRARRFATFIFRSTASSLCSLRETNRSTLEIGMVSSEGMAGIGAFLGVKTSRYQAIVQGEGTALRMKAVALCQHAAENPSLQFFLKLYTHALLAQVSQTTVCNQFHLTKAHLARWLLETGERHGFAAVINKHLFARPMRLSQRDFQFVLPLMVIKVELRVAVMTGGMCRRVFFPQKLARYLKYCTSLDLIFHLCICRHVDWNSAYIIYTSDI